MAEEVYGLLGITAAAAGISCAFDILRAVRSATGLPPAVTDVLFWLAAVTGMTAALLYFNGGRLRGYEAVGAAAGSVLYFSTISGSVVRLFTVIFKIFFDKLKFICKILLTPPRFLYKILCRIFRSEAIKKNKKGIPDEFKKCDHVVYDTK